MLDRRDGLATAGHIVCGRHRESMRDRELI